MCPRVRVSQCCDEIMTVIGKGLCDGDGCGGQNATPRHAQPNVGLRPMRHNGSIACR
jgi:hypothetical protein